MVIIITIIKNKNCHGRFRQIPKDVLRIKLKLKISLSFKYIQNKKIIFIILTKPCPAGVFSRLWFSLTDYDIYYGTDNSENLSNFVRLINRILENGRLERWVGELSGMVYDKDYCVATTYNGKT